MNLSKKLQFLSLLIILITTSSVFAQLSISIRTDEALLKNTITAQTIDDVSNLLKDACKCEVGINIPNTSVILQLPSVDSSHQVQPSSFDSKFSYPYLHYPEHEYSWISNALKNQIILTLNATSFQGISFGLYGLLQEQLGFKFYHPRETKIPTFTNWPLNANFEWKATPRFDKKGFHHHTVHPLELTESVLYPESPNALENVKEFVDWLVRNQQNYMEFYLLESIDKKVWPQHAKQFVDYAHSRGILAGMEVSLHMIQQKAYKLYRNPPASFKKKHKQVKQNMEMLFEADWDIFNIEFASSEFTSGNIKKKQQLQLYIIDQLEKVYHSKLMGRMHVVKHDEEVFGKGEKKEHEFTEEQKKIDQDRGIMIHTVMFYTVFEEHAPVYENENQRHMLVAMEKEQQLRETWYYPESAYWITFDNSVPLFPMSYLSARLDDINLVDSMGIPSHLTFSSGWEWGYWLFDWSIARWSWKHTYNNTEKDYTSTIFLEEFTNDEAIKKLFRKSLILQDEYIKNKNLIQYLISPAITDELPGPGYLQLHPRPRWRYKWMHRKADLATLDTIRKESVVLLQAFSQKQYKIANALREKIPEGHILDELVDGLLITAMRAEHRLHTMQYLLSIREAKLKKDKSIIKHESLIKAQEIRNEALPIVKKREVHYRYPIDLIARKRPETPTCYPFGYLYTVKDLHFWKREEEQIKRNNYSPFFMKIVPILKNIGIVN